MQLTQQEQLICALTGQHGKATMLVRIVQVLGHLSYSLGQYKEALTKFAERLNEPGYDRTPDGYAAMFGQGLDHAGSGTLDYKMGCVLTMLDCLREYDPAQGADFLTYAHHFIGNALDAILGQNCF